MKIKDVFAILALLLIVSFFACKKDDKTGSIPTMATTDPLNYYQPRNLDNNVTGVSRNKAIDFTFSETMDPLTINSSTFTLKQGTTAINGIVTYAGTTATFTPTNTLAAGTS